MPEDTKPKFPQVKKGDKVVVAGAHRHERQLPAEVLAVRKDGLVDVAVEHRDATLTITASPHDPEGKQPDSWRLPPAAAPAAAADAAK